PYGYSYELFPTGNLTQSHQTVGSFFYLQNIAVQWDTSQIPQSATINSVSFKYYAITNDFRWVIFNTFETQKPSEFSPANAEAFFNQTTQSGAVYTEEMPRSGEYTQLLAASAATKLKEKLMNGNNYFAFAAKGGYSQNAATQIHSRESTTGKPTLKVNYTPV
ncbi:MAG: hypothetical protein NUV67_01215, partial [archaeon]|nr:hypothetical protein [archaeon]